MTHENFRVHTYYGRHRFSPSGHRGNIYHNFGVNNTSSKVEHGSQSRGYNLPKALCIRGKAHRLIEYEGRCRIKSNKGCGGPQGI